MKNKAGRPTVLTPENLAVLEQYFVYGCNDKEALFMANIAPSTFYAYCERNPEYQDRKEALRNTPKIKARINVAKSIETGDPLSSRWYLEKKGKDEFATRNEVTGKDGEPLMIIDDITKPDKA